MSLYRTSYKTNFVIFLPTFNRLNSTKDFVSTVVGLLAHDES